MLKKFFSLVLLFAINAHVNAAPCTKHATADSCKSSVVATAAQAKANAEVVTKAAAAVVAPVATKAAAVSRVQKAKDSANALVAAIWNASFKNHPYISSGFASVAAFLCLYNVSDTVKNTVRGMVGLETAPCKDTCPQAK